MFWNGNWFTSRRWRVRGKEMMKCGIDGRARIKKRTRKEAKWKQRTRRDRSVVSRVGHFAHGPAHRGVRDLIYCRVWCHDMFSEFRVFRNSGRWSAKCSTTMVWSMSLSWCIGFFPPKKEKPEYLRKLCEEPDCMCSENGVVWAQTPINVVSSPLPSFLLYFVFFFVTSFLKKYPFPIFHFFPPFPKKILLLMFYLSLLKMFCPWPLQSDKIMQFSSWKNLPFLLIFERLAWSPFYPSFFQELFHIKKMNLFRIFLCFSLLQVFLPSFFHHFLLLFITFRIHLSLSLIFLNNKFPFFLHQKLFNFTFCMHALPLNVLLLFIDLFICCLFFLFLFSVSDFFMKHVFDTSAFPKAFYLFVRHLHTFVCFLHVRSLSLFFQFFFFCVYSLVFLDILLFCSLSWTSVFSCVSFFGYPFWMYPSFFLEILFDLIILFLPVFPFTSSPFFSTTTFFTKLFPCLLSSFKKKKSFLLLPVFSLHEKKLCHWKFVNSFGNFRCWTLHIHLHQFNIFPLMSTLPLYSLLFVHPLCTCSLFCLSVFSRFFFIVRYF